MININILPILLKKVQEDYRILEIDNKRIFQYSTLYYDTDNNYMYFSHHNGKLNYTKIRYRKYVDSDLSFLEIKQKVKGQRTVKHRTKIKDIETTISDFAKKYIENNTPFQNIQLKPIIYTDFKRLTLVTHDMIERVTIDQDLVFRINGTSHKLDNIAIIEIKRDVKPKKSILARNLNNMRAYPDGFSKYCIGRAILEKKLKSNNFKEIFLNINKISNGKYNYRNIS
jgi:hypothetical protein